MQQSAIVCQSNQSADFEPYELSAHDPGGIRGASRCSKVCRLKLEKNLLVFAEGLNGKSMVDDVRSNAHINANIDPTRLHYDGASGVDALSAARRPSVCLPERLQAMIRIVAERLATEREPRSVIALLYRSRRIPISTIWRRDQRERVPPQSRVPYRHALAAVCCAFGMGGT